MKPFALLLSFLFIFSATRAEKVFDFNITCQQAYQEISKLKMGIGEALLQKARQQNPNNLVPVLLESYIDFYTLFLREDPAEYARKQPLFTKRIALLEEGPRSSPYYNLFISIIRIHKAATGIKFGRNWDAAWDCRRAWVLLKENKEKFPSFIADDLMYGTLETMIGTIPQGYKWIASLLGVKGSVTNGMKTVSQFMNSNDPAARLFTMDAQFIYPYLLFYMDNKKEEAIAFIQQRKLDVENNHLFTWMAANLALNNKQSNYTKQVILQRNQSPEYLSLPVWDFELGFAYLYHLETTEAIQYFEKFLTNFKGKFYVKDVYQKLSWAYYLQGNMAAAERARQQVLTKGATDADADKSALKDARTGKWPNPLLLKARLLSDGGYHREAMAVLHGKSEHDFSDPSEKVEVTYRIGRIFHDLRQDNEAIPAYLAAIRLGNGRKEYFSARAALQLGQIYEQKGQKSLAIQYYQTCLDMDGHAYKNSLDQRAKSGIQRCKGE